MILKYTTCIHRLSTVWAYDIHKKATRVRDLVLKKTEIYCKYDASCRSPPPGAGSRQHRYLRGRRHLPRLHLSCRVDRCGRHGGGPLPGAACGGEAGAPADEAEQARAYVAWLCHHVLNPHTMRSCTLSYPQRATARTPCASSGEGQGEHDGSGASHGLSAGEVCACTVVEYVASLGTMHCVV